MVPLTQEMVPEMIQGYRHAWHPTLRALGVAAMQHQRGGRLDVQEHTRNARSRRLA